MSKPLLRLTNNLLYVTSCQWVISFESGEAAFHKFFPKK